MTNYTFAPLPYPADALEPVIDKTTMEIHHGRHHKAYFDNFTAAIKDSPLAGETLEAIFANISKHPAAVRNNGGGYYNHNLYWNVMSQNGGGAPQGELLDAINAAFGSFDAFKTAFKDAGIKQFGSGWAWLSANKDGELEVSASGNQDNPLMEGRGFVPILGIDVWEHAYYLKYKNLRPDYVKAFFEVLDWKKVAEKYEAVLA